MNRPVDIIVTGFTRNAALCARSLETPRRLRQEGLVRAIRYVTWDSPEIDSHIAPVAAMDDVAVTRVPQPLAGGNARQKSVVYQVRNLECALGQVPEDDALVVKTRPDFVFDAGFLRAKIGGFERLNRFDGMASAFGVGLPRAPFRRKIWIPWADANQPFFFEDAAFAGLKCDLVHFVTPQVEERLGPMDDPACGPFAHVVRYGSIFAGRLPIFRRYLAEYAAFANDAEYRNGLLRMLLDDPYFWHLIVANAWILHTAFHIDAGQPGELTFYPNTANAHADWSDATALVNAPPYDDIGSWRANARAGIEVFAGVGRRYGRLMDDAWPRALFTQKMPDIPAETIRSLAHSLANYESGVLREMEDAYYERLARFHRDNWPSRVSAAA